MNFLDVSAASQIVEKELFVRALYLYSESGKVTLSPCFVFKFCLSHVTASAPAFLNTFNEIFLVEGRGTGRFTHFFILIRT